MKLSIYSSYSDFYSFNISPNENINNTIVFNNNFYILFCFFSNLIVSNANGGAIQCSNVESKVLIEFSSFYKCVVNNGYNGGAIYYNCPNGQNNLNKVCASNCETFSSTWYEGGHFIYSLSNNNYLHQLLYTSLTECSKSSKSYCCSYVLLNGNQNFKNSNSSFNFAYVQSGGHFRSSNPTFVYYSIYSNNKDDYSMLLFSNCLESFVKFSNIISNESPLGQGVIHSYFNLINFDNCYFMNNNNFLFYLNLNGQININNCFINHSINSLSNNGPITLGTFITYNLFKTLNLNLFSTELCKNIQYSKLEKNYFNFKIIIIQLIFYLKI